MPSMMPRRILVSSGTSSSSSPALAGAGAISIAATSTKPAAAADNLTHEVGRIELYRSGLEGIEIVKDFSRVNETIVADQGAFAARSPSTFSYNRPATPATMATSARLKTYQSNRHAAVWMWK